MDARPTLKRLLESAEPGVRIPVWCEVLFDADTAVTAYRKLKSGPFGFLLESVVGGEQWARYSFLGSRPKAAWKLEGDRLWLWTPGGDAGGGEAGGSGPGGSGLGDSGGSCLGDPGESGSGDEGGWRLVEGVDDPLGDFMDRLTRAQPRPDPMLPRFWGGAVGYFGYDLVRRFERLGEGPPDDQGLPAAMFLFSDVVVAVDNLYGRAKIITTVETGDAPTADELAAKHRDAVSRLEAAAARLRAPATLEPLDLAAGAREPAEGPGPTADYASNFSRHAFLAGVRRIREHIAAGDAFQVVLSQRLATRCRASSFDLYRALRTINPSPYLFNLDLGDFAIVGASPEVLVRLEDDVVTVRPIAGTRRRGRTPSEDRALARELAADEKELAEHRMLVDLGRNDVGRVSRYGTVTVPELMKVELYSHVMHLCSQVEGEVLEGLSALDVLSACFPAGTVSGAPKVRAMEIIDELEPTARGPYAGAVGHFGWGGRQMDTAIAIRTMVVRNGWAHVQAGAGVVADSDPESECEETLNKARALLRAARMVS